MVNRNINEMYPQSGRVLKENSESINRADYEVARRESELVAASRDGTLYRGWFQGTVPAGATQYFVLLPPPGLRVYGETRAITLLAGSIHAQFLVGGTLGNPVGSPLPSYNFETVDGPAPQSIFQQYDAVTGAEVHSPDTLITAPTTGPIRQPSSQTAAGAHVRISDTRFAVFMLRNDTEADEQATLFITWQELQA